MTENEKTEKETQEKSLDKNSISSEKKGDENSEINKSFTDIIIHFSDFLSKHSVYEAAPENSKVLVFNSDLSFKEMVKAFINEDIYCALIYDSEKEYFIGLITISDILLLFKYIIEQAQQRDIIDYNIFIQEIFSFNKNKNEKNDNSTNNNSNKNKNFDILKYLTKVNFNDYYKIIKKKKKIYNLISISLDASLLDVLKMIYKVGVHRLVVEETKKKNAGENKRKENEANQNINEKSNQRNKNKKKDEMKIKKEKEKKEK
jgi:CBS domain-containing protein